MSMPVANVVYKWNLVMCIVVIITCTSFVAVGCVMSVHPFVCLNVTVLCCLSVCLTKWQLLLLVTCCIAGLWHFYSVYSFPSFLIFCCPFYFQILVDDARSLSICTHFLPQNAFPFILPSVISPIKTSFLSTCPSHLCFCCHIVFDMLLTFKNRCICYFVLPTDL